MYVTYSMGGLTLVCAVWFVFGASVTWLWSRALYKARVKKMTERMLSSE